MTKSYKSFTQVAFSVILPGGGSKRISFSPRTGSGSVYITDDERVQNAIERHPGFGKKFFLDGASNTEPERKAVAPKPSPASAPAKAEPENGKAAAPAKENTAKVIPFTNLSDAKEYLARHFEIPRTQLRSKEAIKRYAAMNNVVFDGIDN